MATITLKGNEINTCGTLPAVGSQAPDFTLVTDELGEVSLKELSGKNVILNIFPSIDTPVCASSVRKFNEEAASVENTVVICVSADLPFAMKRFCGAEGISNCKTGSVYRNEDFGRQYGVTIVDGPLKGLLARAVIVVNGEGKVVHAELVPEIAQEPNYQAALDAARG